MKLLKGNNLELLKTLEDNSIDSIVTDPPYGLSFMNKKWDYDVPSKAFWTECLRVLKPGGHVLSFGGTRTYHRMVVNLEDAGFEVRDCISWLYGSGFPKSLNIGKAIQKQSGDIEVIGRRKGAGTPGNTYINTDLKNEVDVIRIDNEYGGWGTALKPAQELICLARKPLSEKTVAENCLKWGTGGINIDGCRIGSDTIKTNGYGDKGFVAKEGYEPSEHEGRFPANIIFDEYAAMMLDEQSGISKSTDKIRKNNQSKNTGYENGASCYGKYNDIDTNGYSDSGGASRFFYCAKVSKSERNEGLDGFEEKIVENIDQLKDYIRENGSIRKSPLKKNNHPTVKPIKLMTYLCRLITPKGGTILDPFMGSGSTGIAAIKEGFNFIGMEMDEDYFKIAQARIKYNET